jgi:hypothetical protein
MQELESQGYKQDGIVLLKNEARILLSVNFNWKDGDPMPENIELFGLPVTVQE